MSKYFTFTCSTGNISARYATLTNCHATGGARFTALTRNGCVDGVGNTGWLFELLSNFIRRIVIF